MPEPTKHKPALPRVLSVVVAAAGLTASSCGTPQPADPLCGTCHNPKLPDGGPELELDGGPVCYC